MTSSKGENMLQKRVPIWLAAAIVFALFGAGYQAAVAPAGSTPTTGSAAACEAGCVPTPALAATAEGEAASSSLFDTTGFPQRWNCGTWPESLGWLHIAADLTIWMSYVAIPVMLLVFLRRRRDAIPFSMVWVLFAAFVLFCGAGHFLEAAMFWWPAYRLTGMVKLVTAVVSAATVIALVRVLPLALALRTPADLERVVTERTAALRESEERFRGTFEQAAVGMAEVSADGVLLRVNDRFCEIVGSGRDQLVDTPLVGQGRGDGPLLDRATLHDLASQPHPRTGTELRFRSPDGSVVWGNLTVAASHDVDGNLDHFIVVLEDISRAKELEAELRSMNTELEARVHRRTVELERSNADLEQFAYVASHDLQEPLRMVTSYVQLIEERYAEELDDAGRDFIGFAVDGTARMKALILDLLTFSRVGAKAREPKPVDLNEVMDIVERNLTVAIESANATVSRCDLPVVDADEQQLVQMLQNLVGNSIKFRGEASPCVEVRVISADSEWQVQVQDNGIGIDPAHADRVFQVFQRLHQRDDYAGTGIGLAICRKVAERNGGRIWVEPTDEPGTLFCFTIPRRERAQPRSAA